MTLYWLKRSDKWYRHLFSVQQVKLILICVQTLTCTHYQTNLRNKPKTELKVHKSSQGEDKISYSNHTFPKSQSFLKHSRKLYICIFRAINILYTYIIAMYYIDACTLTRHKVYQNIHVILNKPLKETKNP